MKRPTPRRTPHPRLDTRSLWALHGTAAPSPAADRGWGIVALILTLSFFVATCLMIAGPHRIGDYFTESDFYGAYAQGARLIQHGHLVPARYTVVGPGYEVALALAGFLVRDLFLAAQLLSAVSAACIVGLWSVLLRRRVDARLGAAAALFMVTHFGLFHYAWSATTDTFGIALQAAALFALLGARAPTGPRGAAARVPASGNSGTAAGLRHIVAAGVLAALAFLTRYNALALLPAGWIVILWGGAGASRRGAAAFAFTLGFLLPVVPWVLFSLGHGGILGSQLHHNIAYEVFARARGIAWDDYQKTLQSQFPNLGAVIARDPGAVAARMLANVFEHLRDDALKLLGWPVALAAGAGLALAFRGRWLPALWPLILPGALLFLTLVPVFYSERYSLALLPVYAMLAGAAFASPRWAVAAGRTGRVWLKTLALPALLAITLPAGRAQQLRALDQLPVEVLDAGRALRAARQPGDRVISRKGHIAYYGDCEPLGFPFADSLASLARYASDTKARWLYFSWPEAETRPAFWYLLDTSGVVPGLSVVYASPTRPAVLYEIGRGFGARPAWMDNDTLHTWHVLRARAAVEPGNPALFVQIGMMSWWLHRLPEAREALMRATTLDPSARDAFDLLGRVEVERGDYEAARDAYRSALALKPGDPNTRLGYGLALFMLGRNREAALAWRPIIPMTIDPRALRAMMQLFDSLGDEAAANQARERLAAVGTRR